MSHAEQITDVSGAPELPSGTADNQPEDVLGPLPPNAVLPGSQKNEFDLDGCADLETAALCEERAQLLSLRLAEVEDSVRLTEMYLSASGAIEDILTETRRLLEEARTLSEPAGRTALAASFSEIKRQIDDIVAEAGFYNRNLAAGDNLTLGFDEDNSHFYKIESSALSCDALGLSGDECNFNSNAGLVAASVEAENAINTVRTRRTVIEMTVSVLSSRAKFIREKIQSLRDTSRFLLRHDKAYDAICGIAARRVGRPPGVESKCSGGGDNPATQTAKPDFGHGAAAASVTLSAGNGDNTSKTGGSSNPQPSCGEALDHLAKDLARLLLRDSYLTNWFKYEAGDEEVFTRHFAQEYGPDMIDACKQKYASDDDFRQIADKYMASFEARIEDQTEGQSDRRAKIDTLLKSNQGTLYVAMARASGRL